MEELLLLNEGLTQLLQLKEAELRNLETRVLNANDCLLNKLRISKENCLAEVARLENNIQRMQNERLDLKGHQDHQDEQIEKLNSKLTHLQQLLQEKKNEKENMQDSLKQKMNDVSNKQKVFEDISADDKLCMERVAKNIALFEKHLGLKVTTTSSNTCCFSFNQICRDNPEQIFEVAVNISEDRYYVETRPSLPELSSLEQTLNETNDLTGFLANARQLFAKVQSS